MSDTFGSVLLDLVKAKEMQFCAFFFLTQMSVEGLGIFPMMRCS